MSICLDDNANNNNQKPTEVLKYLDDTETKNDNKGKKIEVFKDIENFSKEQILYLIEIATKTHRNEDVIICYEKLFQFYPSTSLTIDELNTFESSLKVFVAGRQKNINYLYRLYSRTQNKENDFDDMENDNQLLLNGITNERKRTEGQVANFVNRYLKIIDNNLLQNIAKKDKEPDRSAEVFLYRIKGDINKYLSQVENEDKNKREFIRCAQQAYYNSYNSAVRYLDVQDVTYLNAMLSYTNFLVYFKNNKSETQNILNLLTTKKEFREILNSKNEADKDKKEIAEELEKIKNSIEK